eukprot:TRINITY_DN6629_c0_g1_i1.p1 TRINITY_DN6629_c0_g1~~TRINITY_DN6629_c0_g1_i1.p1  ORF type:complete len:276 (-),score=33.84 TRINITY_DN6629_c0_g1_i1:4-744(-)
MNNSEHGYSYCWIRERMTRRSAQMVLILGLFEHQKLIEVNVRIPREEAITIGKFNVDGNGDGIVISRECVTWVDQYFICHFEGQLKKFKMYDGKYKRSDGICSEGILTTITNWEYETEGKMTWPDGFYIKGKWIPGRFNGIPLDLTKHIHPRIQQQIDQLKCVRSIPKEERLIPQAIHECDVNQKVYCMPCVMKGCHDPSPVQCKDYRFLAFQREKHSLDGYRWDWTIIIPYDCECPQEDCSNISQ